MNPLNRSAPARSCTQTGVHVPILNVFDAFADESDASNPTRMFSTSTLSAAPEHYRSAAEPHQRSSVQTVAADQSQPVVHRPERCLVVISMSLFMSRRSARC